MSIISLNKLIPFGLLGLIALAGCFTHPAATAQNNLDRIEYHQDQDIHDAVQAVEEADYDSQGAKK